MLYRVPQIYVDLHEKTQYKVHPVPTFRFSPLVVAVARGEAELVELGTLITLGLQRIFGW